MNCATFLSTADQFRLGSLPTEARHPLTGDLSNLSKQTPQEALEVLRRVDLLALEKMTPSLPRLRELGADIKATLADGGRIFLCGCGATGRLSLSLEVLWRQLRTRQPEALVGFMAGGDLAMVHSVEKFEDHPEFGARQLLDLGFRAGDLLISTTEGGETPFVIGATEEAARIGPRSPWFLYCNPDPILIETVERSERVIHNPAIESLSLFVGPMALSGSTRMQASTVLMLGVGMALFDEWDSIERLAEALRQADLSTLAELSVAEADLYLRGDFLSYRAARHGITIMTDTTERSPTFSLRAFENLQEPERAPALAYFHLPGTSTSQEAWRALLGRDPRPVTWSEVAAVAGHERLLGFDFSDGGARARAGRIPANSSQEVFRVDREGDVLVLELGTHRATYAAPETLLEEHLLLKLLLNMHSAVVMGRLERFESNLMTYVRPSNMKLIDRTIRYVQHLVGPGHAYPEVAEVVFAEMEKLAADEPIVLKAARALAR